ncbi:hypothetical protein BDD43_3924 [Mucilaginibacter gracilis]|uniref:Uncharacterized protein n=1 Tax=Mucilaginibacter gracilis TaxID=423350 RepID=A0A495J407_9SPHI|nr:hypothetical protein [Mucilaginibacter gracilis]RKR83710.1 hypothetical protein BDD43_3924 [Mucilaginibacter gracilis]
MLNPDQKIPCPICNATILFDVKQLLMGIQFGCPNCHASVGLASESKELVQQTMHKIEELKAGASK